MRVGCVFALAAFVFTACSSSPGVVSDAQAIARCGALQRAHYQGRAVVVSGRSGDGSVECAVTTGPTVMCLDAKAPKVNGLPIAWPTLTYVRVTRSGHYTVTRGVHPPGCNHPQVVPL